MKVYVYKTSDFTIGKGEVREYKSLDECIPTLLKTEDFDGRTPEIVISFPSDLPVHAKDCEYEIEIYDDWRE